MPRCSLLFLLLMMYGCSHHIALPEHISAHKRTLKLEIATPLPVISCGLVNTVQLDQLSKRTDSINTPSEPVLVLDKIELSSGFWPAWDLTAHISGPNGNLIKITEHAEFNWHWKPDVVCHHAALHFPVAIAALEMKALQQLGQGRPGK